MHLVRFAVILLSLMFILGLSTLTIFTHPAFVLLLVGFIATIYNKLHPNKPTRRYVS